MADITRDDISKISGAGAWNWKANADDNLVETWTPQESKLDFSNLTYAGDFSARNPQGEPEKFTKYTDATGRTFNYDPRTDSFAFETAPLPTSAPDNAQTNFQGIQYFTTAPGNSNEQYQTYYVDPSTNKPVLYDEGADKSGFLLNDSHLQSGGFDKWITNNGWMIPLAMITAGAAYSAMGGAAAAGEGGLTGASGAGGSMGAGSSLQLAPAGMGAGTGVGGGIVAPSLAGGLGVGAGGVLGAGALSAETIAAMEAMQAGAGYGLNASQVPNLAAGLELGAESGLTASQALDYANQARKIYSTGSNLAKLLGGSSTGTGARTGAGTGTGTQQLADSLRSLATPIQTNDYLGQYKMNQNPFTFTSQGQTTALPGTYDVSGSSMANALRKS